MATSTSICAPLSQRQSVDLSKNDRPVCPRFLLHSRFGPHEQKKKTSNDRYRSHNQIARVATRRNATRNSTAARAELLQSGAGSLAPISIRIVSIVDGRSSSSSSSQIHTLLSSQLSLLSVFGRRNRYFSRFGHSTNTENTPVCSMMLLSLCCGSAPMANGARTSIV